MFNLLPDSLKEEIIKEYKLRKLIIVLLIIVFLQASFFVFMMPSWVNLSNKENELLERVKKFDNSPIVSGANALKLTVKLLNSEAIVMDKTLEYQEFIPILNTIISNKTNSIKITDVLFTSISSSTSMLVVQGVSSTRDDLVNYKNTLDQTKMFKSVDLPVSNLAKDRNIVFSINLSTLSNI